MSSVSANPIEDALRFIGRISKMDGIRRDLRKEAEQKVYAIRRAVKLHEKSATAAVVKAGREEGFEITPAGCAQFTIVSADGRWRLHGRVFPDGRFTVLNESNGTSIKVGGLSGIAALQEVVSICSDWWRERTGR